MFMDDPVQLNGILTNFSFFCFVILFIFFLFFFDVLKLDLSAFLCFLPLDAAVHSTAVNIYQTQKEEIVSLSLMIFE